jgi:ketosteroid isomerase-like protein
VDPKKPSAGLPTNLPPNSPDELARNSAADEFLNRLRSDMRRPAPSQEAVSAAQLAMQRLAAESVADAGAVQSGAPPLICEACGHHNRPHSRFCGACGVLLQTTDRQPAPGTPSEAVSAPETEMPPGPHHYHHHFHHHYFASGPDLASSLGGKPVAADPTTAKLRTPGGGAPMSRIETAVRKVTLDWALACNSRQLDDLVSTYAADALVLRPNHPAVRGTAAIREFFFNALDSGFGEVELDPMRVDVAGDVAYEAGRCKMLVPVVVGKRREERGKYLTVLARQSNGEWRIVSDCWSTDLSLTPAAEVEPPKPIAPGSKPAPARKSP